MERNKWYENFITLEQLMEYDAPFVSWEWMGDSNGNIFWLNKIMKTNICDTKNRK